LEALDIKSLALEAKSLALSLKGCGLDPCLLSSECLDAVIYEEHYQNILQVVKAERKEMPRMSKSKRQADLAEADE